MRVRAPGIHGEKKVYFFNEPRRFPFYCSANDAADYGGKLKAALLNSHDPQNEYPSTNTAMRNSKESIY